MKARILSTVLLCSLASFATHATDELAQKASTDRQQQQQVEKQRRAEFNLTEKELNALKAELTAKRDQLQSETDALAKTFGENENTLARLEEQLRLETGSLGELFGVVRQNAKELKSELHFSVTGVSENTHSAVVDDIVAAKSLPSMPQLTGFWQSLLEQINASGEVKKENVTLINGEGQKQQVEAVRIGALGLVTDNGYIEWNGKRGDAVEYRKQPEQGPTLSSLASVLSGDMSNVVLDPSRGIMLEQLAHTPSLSDRLQAGGVVGKIILGLLAVGLVIALVRGVSLANARRKIAAQLKQPENPGDNPLGRVLAVYNKEQNRSVEALELRLLEAVVDEQAALEKGLSMLKLLAALAPMLGLLGTVTGMIETFQVITQFGNGDPKVMAGGISMALVTTVLGLVSAMPLLLAHNILSTQSENIRNILEKQGIGLVAEQAEKTDLEPVGTPA
ncbi:MotA/TolQ/ExbB proton channel family protein [Vibrio paucivorans]|uniref:MotA/TolQ/ExbB proton channel family protein n=1 Tax=Vibrio paucivorans TaxID=2829489 RepID=A0A9X3CGA9_9VIBR|nr:MotA/TolQ/ExbB proton channel family protein [Vibrio paucivorans]MCW8335241.1 MotA/TolQ/ExbB proton channel family protein [Vibrio paucivorans]